MNTVPATIAIADTDFAETSAQLAKDQIITQSSAAVIAQANQIPP